MHHETYLNLLSTRQIAKASNCLQQTQSDEYFKNQQKLLVYVVNQIYVQKYGP